MLRVDVWWQRDKQTAGFADVEWFSVARRILAPSEFREISRADWPPWVLAGLTAWLVTVLGGWLLPLLFLRGKFSDVNAAAKENAGLDQPGHLLHDAESLPRAPGTPRVSG